MSNKKSFFSVWRVTFTIALPLLLSMLSFYISQVIAGRELLPAIDKSQVHFVVGAVIGLLSIGFAYFSRNDKIIPGLVLGGVFCLGSAYGYVWHSATDLIKVVSLLIALGMVIAISYKYTDQP